MKFLRVKENCPKSKSDFLRHFTSVKLRVYMQLIIADFLVIVISLAEFWFRLAQPYNHGFRVISMDTL